MSFWINYVKLKINGEILISKLMNSKGDFDKDRINKRKIKTNKVKAKQVDREG